MSTTRDENAIVICDEPDDKIEVVCSPFEPELPDYSGERLLAIHRNVIEESGAVLTAAQAARLAELLTAPGGPGGGPVTARLAELLTERPEQ